MMKQYHLYIFSQDGCPPCARLKEHLRGLPEPQQQELDIVPMKTMSGDYTALAAELNVTLTPTLVVCHEELQCEIDRDGEEYCDGIEVPVERFVGANNIIDALPSTLAAYTYAIDEG